MRICYLLLTSWPLPFRVSSTGNRSPAEEEEGERQILLPTSQSSLVPGGSQQIRWRASPRGCWGMAELVSHPAAKNIILISAADAYLGIYGRG